MCDALENENRRSSFVTSTMCNMRSISHVLFTDKCILFKLIMLLLLSHNIGQSRGNALLVHMTILD